MLSSVSWLYGEKSEVDNNWDGLRLFSNMN